jgi:TonB family protein
MGDAAQKGRMSHPILKPLITLLLGTFWLAGCGGARETVPPVTLTEQDAAFQSYLTSVQSRLYQQKFLMKPFYGAAKEPMVIVAILLDSHGAELGSGIRQSSGNADVDRTALAMVARASPFPAPPPPLLKSEQLGISIAIPLPKTRREWREAFE